MTHSAGQFFQDMFVVRIIPAIENPGMAKFDGTLDSVPQYQYSIMGVQYDNYHLLYGCEDDKGRQDSLSWLLAIKPSSVVSWRSSK
ncbi:Hypothetical predicted protein [Mytilus galloprovincialis]|uniref:Uncharacterized protein n=1 Tax=Mytilus galloprovincialis TaxID=29158 RepID=A0A8B6EWU1_MYTGA|nr:Hypothetical predicted protein [Mytilus galloprovincialis]